MNYLSRTAPVSQVRLLAGDTASLLWVRMDISVLPNNNHPEKFLQLDVRMLPASCGVTQVGALLLTQKHWQNRVYDQVGLVSLWLWFFSSQIVHGTESSSGGHRVPYSQWNFCQGLQKLLLILNSQFTQVPSGPTAAFQIPCGSKSTCSN